MKKQFLCIVIYVCIAYFTPANIQAYPPECLPESEPAGTLITRLSKSDLFSCKLQLANLQQLPTQIMLSDMQHKTVYLSRSVTRHNGSRLQFNLSDVPPGRYVLRVIHPTATRDAIIYVTKDGLWMSEFK